MLVLKIVKPEVTFLNLLLILKWIMEDRPMYKKDILANMTFIKLDIHLIHVIYLELSYCAIL